MDEIDFFKYLISGLAAMIGAIIGFIFTAKELNLKNLETQLKAVDFVNVYRTEVKSWGIEGIKYLDALVRLAEDNPKMIAEGVFRQQLFDLKSQISTHIDIGRIYFPNDKIGSYGIEKGSSYQGLRKPILDALVSAWISSDAMSYTDQSVNKKKFYKPGDEIGENHSFYHTIKSIKDAYDKLITKDPNRTYSLQTVIIMAKRQFVSSLNDWLNSKDFLPFAESMAKGSLLDIHPNENSFVDILEPGIKAYKTSATKK